MWDHNGESKTPSLLAGLKDRRQAMDEMFKRPSLKIVLFNGPPRSGKDTAAALLGDLLAKRGVLYGTYSFASPLKKAAHALYGLNVPEKHFEDRKDKPADEFFGGTPRRVYIDLSERAAKPIWGNDFFAKVAAQAMSRMKSHVVVSDCGFQHEIDVLKKSFPIGNILLIKMHRKGCDYSNDSRSYIKHDEDATFNIMNDQTIDHLRQDLDQILTHIGEFK